MVEEEKHLDSLFAALADPTRRAIVARLATGPLTVTELAEPFDMSLAAVSKHIHVLDRAGVLKRDRQGRNIECSLNPATLKPVADWIGDYERFWNERLDKLAELIKENQRRRS
jgi:DNA-binding transcriptional ArsR family regulator